MGVLPQMSIEELNQVKDMVNEVKVKCKTIYQGRF